MATSFSQSVSDALLIIMSRIGAPCRSFLFGMLILASASHITLWMNVMHMPPFHGIPSSLLDIFPPCTIDFLEQDKAAHYEDLM